MPLSRTRRIRNKPRGSNPTAPRSKSGRKPFRYHGSFIDEQLRWARAKRAKARRLRREQRRIAGLKASLGI